MHFFQSEFAFILEGLNRFKSIYIDFFIQNLLVLNFYCIYLLPINFHLERIVA